MPRAKRTATARAEARRRYRATHNAPDEFDELDELADGDEPTAATAAAATATKSQPRKATTAASANPPRPGIATAFRQAFKPVDLRGDIQALPMLLIDKAFWIRPARSS